MDPSCSRKEVDGSGWWWICTGEEEKVLVVFILLKLTLPSYSPVNTKNMNNTARTDKGRERHTPIRATSCKLKRKFMGGGGAGPLPLAAGKMPEVKRKGARAGASWKGVRERRKPAYAYYSLGDSPGADQ